MADEIKFTLKLEFGIKGNTRVKENRNEAETIKSLSLLVKNRVTKAIEIENLDRYLLYTDMVCNPDYLLIEPIIKETYPFTISGCHETLLGYEYCAKGIDVTLYFESSNEKNKFKLMGGIGKILNRLNTGFFKVSRHYDERFSL